MANRKVALLHGMVGADFSLLPNQVVECSEDHAARLVDDGAARDLKPGEPTDEQKAKQFSFVAQAKMTATETDDKQDANRSEVAKPKAKAKAKAK